MNRRYSGDTRDLFKIDLVCMLMKELTTLRSFTLVPMLTASGIGTTARKGCKADLAGAIRRGRAGTRNRELLAHMKRLREIDDDKEFFRGIRSIFREENILIEILDESEFSHRTRSRYFDNLIGKFPKKTLLLLDPDIGLETKHPTKRHLLFAELARISHSLDPGSILMIYQHFPRVPRTQYVHGRCRAVREITGSEPVAITDNEILFLMSTKLPALRQNLLGALSRYARTYEPHLSVITEG